MEQLREIMTSKFPSIDFEKEKNLIDDGLITSIDVVGIITELEDAFGISVTMEYIQPMYFQSLESMWEMIEELA
ncbi:MAG: acyl carrier protein [Clostridiales bacterium]|nr:acyl carrier protein [Clostridiales bacterium]